MLDWVYLCMWDKQKVGGAEKWMGLLACNVKWSKLLVGQKFYISNRQFLIINNIDWLYTQYAIENLPHTHVPVKQHNIYAFLLSSDAKF